MALTQLEFDDLQKQLKELKEARRTGMKRVIFNERDITYKSDADMAAAQVSLENEIAEALAPRRRRRPSVVLASFRTGYR